MKYLVVLSVVLAFVAITESVFQWPYLTGEQREFIKNLKFEQLPSELKVALKKSVRDGDSSNWCCVNNEPVKSIQRSKVGTDTIKVQTKEKVGYKKCEMWDWEMCPIYDLKYTNKVKYHIVYYEVPDETSCKHEDIKCCDDHAIVAGSCIEVSEATKYAESLLKLKEAGLIIG